MNRVTGRRNNNQTGSFSGYMICPWCDHELYQDGMTKGDEILCEHCQRNFIIVDIKVVIQCQKK